MSPIDCKANLYLIGYRASGKTTVGRRLAGLLNYRFVDCDHQFRARYGEISAFVRNYGWPEFRRRESLILRELCAQSHLVVATGGGVILAEENRRLLQQSGKIWALLARPETVYQRLLSDSGTNDAQRPSLTASDGLWEEVVTTMHERCPLYLATADRTIAVDDLSPEEIAARIHLDMEVLAYKRGNN